MDFSKAALVVVVTLILVIGINAAIYYSLSRRNEIHQIELLRKASQSARDPWKVENDALQELSRRVTELKQGSAPTGDQDNQVDQSRGPRSE